MKINILSILIVWTLGCGVVFGQEEKIIYGYVADTFTEEQQHGTQVRLLQKDSVAIDSVWTQDGTNGGRPQAVFMFRVKKDGDFLIACAKEGYETSITPISLKFHRREKTVNLGFFHMKKSPIAMKEVTVKATKVKFYHSGDTLVYNADAFALSEGSMLDALIEQLDGVELKDDGRIYVNGKYVESLLLNGKDFFKNDRRVMLDNLPAYMVDKVKVFEKNSDMAMITGIEEHEKPLVVDVGLKKQYLKGIIANAEAGGGTEERYLARLFGLRLTEQSRVSLFGNVNNLNETRKPGRNGDWSLSSLAGGQLDTKVAGVDYVVDDRQRKWQMSGNAKLDHDNSDRENRTNRLIFLPEGDNSGFSEHREDNRSTAFATDHTIELLDWERQRQITITPKLNYRHFDNQSHATAYEQSSHGDTLNRSAGHQHESGHALNAGLAFNGTFKVAHTEDFIYTSGGFDYNETESETKVRRQWEYPINTEKNESREMLVDQPLRRHNYWARFSYSYLLLSAMRMVPFYQFKKSYTGAERTLDRVDLNARDEKNSYDSRQHDYTHTYGIELSWSKPPVSRVNNDWRVKLELPLRSERNRLSYQSAAIDTSASRRLFFFEPRLSAIFKPIGMKQEYKFVYFHSRNTPSMIYALPVTYDADPLNIYRFGEKLKNSGYHDFSLSYSNNMKDQKMLGANLGYHMWQDGMTMHTVYDRETGGRTISPTNVSGNWNTTAGVNFSTPMGKKKHFTFSTHTQADYANHVDLTSYTTDATINRSNIHNFQLSETLQGDYRFRTLHIGAKIHAAWRNVTSSRADFSDINALDMNYSLNARTDLPWGMQLATDFTLYTRRGYNYSEMNTSDFVWNARLSKSLFRGRLVAIVDAFDILGQLSNVAYHINEQGRTETWTNSIPRYVMLHAIFKLDKQPKNKKEKK